MTNLSLYELIKQKSQEKGRSLKIIVDWDEVLFPLKPFILRKALKISTPFKKYFREFWEEENTENYYTKNFVKGHSDNTEEFQKVNKFVKEKTNSKHDPNLYNEIPYLNVADDLLKLFKEELIERCVIISAYRKFESGYPPSSGDPRKREKFAKTFGNFPQFEIELTATTKNEEGKYSPYRWEVIKEKYSDFDMLIDDSKTICKKTANIFPEMCIATPDYKVNRAIQLPNIYHISVAVSDLKDEDFVKAAEEYKAKQKSAETQSTAKQKNYWPLVIGISLVGAGVIAGLIYYFLSKKKASK